MRRFKSIELSIFFSFFFLENSTNPIIRSDLQRLQFRFREIAAKGNARAQAETQGGNRSREENKRKETTMGLLLLSVRGRNSRGHSRRGRKLRKADTVITEERAI